MDTKELVFRALDNAKANGYAFDDGTHAVDAICDDLASYDADLESIDPSELAPHVRAWLAQ